MSFNFMAAVTALILEALKKENVTVAIVSPPTCHEVMGLDVMIFVFFFFFFLNVEF